MIKKLVCFISNHCFLGNICGLHLVVSICKLSLLNSTKIKMHWSWLRAKKWAGQWCLGDNNRWKNKQKSRKYGWKRFEKFWSSKITQPILIIFLLRPQIERTQIQGAGRESKWAWSSHSLDKVRVWPNSHNSPPLVLVIWAHAGPNDQTLRKEGYGGRDCRSWKGRGHSTS